MKFSRKSWRWVIVCILAHTTVFAAPRPNIIVILADDLGYGDVHALNPEKGQIPTPGMDRLAKEGMIFTDAHSNSSVCTPTRYGVLTGRYSWRTHKQSGVLFGFDQPLIAEDRLTVAGLLQQHGYQTAIVGKWHLGLGLVDSDGRPTRGQRAPVDGVNWEKRITGGPVDLGFDYWYGISASLDMPPYIWIENDQFVGTCTTTKAFHRKGPAHADFEAIDVLDEIGRKSAEFLQRQSEEKPFFLYVPLTSPHAPIVPSDQWRGKSSLGLYGDFVMQTDAIVARITAAVDKVGLAENTMIVVTSDNGCSKVADIPALKRQGHFPNAQFRGSKSDLWDGGHRVPFLVRWPAGVKAGSTSDEVICLTDLMATCAELSGAKLPSHAGEDSVSFVPALAGKPIESSRKGIVHHSVSGQFAYREGKWKLLLTRASGGWTKEKMEDDSPAQLYDMEVDPEEQHNLYKSHPEVVDRLLNQLEDIVAKGRSTPGPATKNDIANIRLKKGRR
ncbi:MAG: sulfatase family protein [Verrucomicrobiales bacterium]